MQKWYPKKKQQRFCNIPQTYNPESLLWGTVPSVIQSFISRFRRKVHSPDQWIVHSIVTERSDKVRISWIGHATFLIQGGGYNIITDPIFGNIASIFRRLLKPGISIDALPPIDYILISHNHLDHMDASSLHAIKQINPDVQVLVPQGDKAWFDSNGFAHSHEHMWWDTQRITDSIKCTFLPSVHWSQRGLFDKNRSLWGSWMISIHDTHIYFAGDTAEGDHFVQIAREFPAISTALMPVGPCEPSEWMKHNHLSSETALQSFITLQAKEFIPMHWGTFAFGNDHFEEPIIRLKHAWKMNENRLHTRQLHIVRAGAQLTLHTDTAIPEVGKRPLPKSVQETKSAV